MESNKFLCADDTRIRKISCPVSEPVDRRQFISFFPLFIHQLRVQPGPLAGIQRTGFINEFTIFLQTIPDFDPSLGHTQIQAQKARTVAGLHVISQRRPPIIFGTFDDIRTHGIEINIGQTIHQSAAVLDDHALESVPPEIPFPAILFVIIPGKTLFDFFC